MVSLSQYPLEVLHHEVRLVDETLDNCLINVTPEMLIWDKAYYSDGLDDRLLKEPEID